MALTQVATMETEIEKLKTEAEAATELQARVAKLETDVQHMATTPTPHEERRRRKKDVKEDRVGEEGTAESQELDSIIAIDWWEEREAVATCWGYFNYQKYKDKYNDQQYQDKCTFANHARKSYWVLIEDSTALGGHCSWSQKQCTCPQGRICDLTVHVPHLNVTDGENNDWKVYMDKLELKMETEKELFKGWKLKGQFRNFECIDNRPSKAIYQYHVACRQVSIEQELLGRIKCGHMGDYPSNDGLIEANPGMNHAWKSDQSTKPVQEVGVCGAMTRYNANEPIAAEELQCTGFACTSIPRLKITNTVNCTGMLACGFIGFPRFDEKETQSTIRASSKVVLCDGVYACFNSCWQAEKVTCNGVWACWSGWSGQYNQVNLRSGWSAITNACRLHISPSATTYDFSAGLSSIPAWVSVSSLPPSSSSNLLEPSSRQSHVFTKVTDTPVDSWQSVPSVTLSQAFPIMYGGVARSGVILFDQDYIKLWKPSNQTTCWYDQSGSNYLKVPLQTLSFTTKINAPAFLYKNLREPDAKDGCGLHDLAGFSNDLAGFQNKYPYPYSNHVLQPNPNHQPRS